MERSLEYDSYVGRSNTIALVAPIVVSIVYRLSDVTYLTLKCNQSAQIAHTCTKPKPLAFCRQNY